MTKYSTEFKIKLVLEYLSGKSGGLEKVAKKYGISNESNVRIWINAFKS